MAAHRPLTAASELAQVVAVLARAQQDAVWDRTQDHNKLRSELRRFYPAIRAFVSLTKSPGVRAHHDRRREADDRHVTAQLNLSNRFMDLLFTASSTKRPTTWRRPHPTGRRQRSQRQRLADY
ncbi:hypothetical protein M2163_000485 [Streptomyces sp. SAI-135]|jgi:hypothetical protein|uniref:hypothetical protein n=1 Tax=Streptomyces sp. SAI-124 TaxID=3377730 RepID=UPI00247C90CF|nr:hypothetical protein [Streptomyces sp. SAI-090]MDH6554627.1 hypothetical protein [Streptomyces sp. SAI-041]MDH6573893.1 hypothetical protein [Streptomyces sp. SAI-117]MDH6581371.1 hypothetical protein [Streptomyces sp. SAI-133]MDH6613377.1 hypothetical protein [Streptomyces sp. SAI-135]